MPLVCRLFIHTVHMYSEGDIFSFVHYPLFNTASSAAPHIPPVSEDAGIEPRTVATSTLAVTVRRSNHSARSRVLVCTRMRQLS
jgi:hypothetical protein